MVKKLVENQFVGLTARKEINEKWNIKESQNVKYVTLKIREFITHNLSYVKQRLLSMNTQ